VVASTDLTHLRPDPRCVVTADNSAAPARGAAGLLIMDEATAASRNLRPRARWLATASCAELDPHGYHASIAVTKAALARAGLRCEQLDHVEVNETFASIPLAWMRRFPVDPRFVNPRGGAIALGDPVGAAGIRMLTTMLHALEATGGQYGMQVADTGAGRAEATLIERV
jgi:acetyl-CoA acyltransferase